MGKKIIGVILLIAGVVFLLFGFSYINSPQYKMMSVVNGFTGSSDPTGNVAIGIGAVASILGLILVLVGRSGNGRTAIPVATKRDYANDFDSDYPSVRPIVTVEEPQVSVKESAIPTPSFAAPYEPTQYASPSPATSAATPGRF